MFGLETFLSRGPQIQAPAHHIDRQLCVTLKSTWQGRCLVFVGLTRDASCLYTGGVMAPNISGGGRYFFF